MAALLLIAIFIANQSKILHVSMTCTINNLPYHNFILVLVFRTNISIQIFVTMQ